MIPLAAEAASDPVLAIVFLAPVLAALGAVGSGIAGAATAVGGALMGGLASAGSALGLTGGAAAGGAAAAGGVAAGTGVGGATLGAGATAASLAAPTTAAITAANAAPIASTTATGAAGAGATASQLGALSLGGGFPSTGAVTAGANAAPVGGLTAPAAAAPSSVGAAAPSSVGYNLGGDLAQGGGFRGSSPSLADLARPGSDSLWGGDLGQALDTRLADTPYANWRSRAQEYASSLGQGGGDEQQGGMGSSPTPVFAALPAAQLPKQGPVQIPKSPALRGVDPALVARIRRYGSPAGGLS